MASLGIVSNAKETDSSTCLTMQEIESAMTSDKFEMIINDFMSEPERLGLTKNQVDHAVVGQPFSLARIDGNSVENNQFVKHFPIYSEGNMIALLTASEPEDGDVIFSISQAYAPEIQEYLNNSKGNVALATYNQELLAVDEENNVDAIFSFESTSEVSTYSIDEKLPSLRYDQLNFSENVLTAETEQPFISTAALQSRQVVHNGSDWYIWPLAEIKQQTQMGCWATCIASMARYEYPSLYGNLTESQVINTMGYKNGAKRSQLLTALNHYFTAPYYPKETGSYFTPTDIETITANDDPAVLWLENSTVGAAHAIVLAGYRADLTGTVANIWVMDPAIGRTTLSTYNYNYTDYTNVNRTYRWVDSFRFYYR